MKKHITWSNLIFVIIIGLFFYKPSRVWFTRKLSFSPSVNKISADKKITNYNWNLKGLNTNDINFDSTKGKVVFLNFWATWCPPCIAEFPFIQSFYNDYKNKVDFIFVTNENWPEVAVFFEKNGYDIPTYQTLNGYPLGLPNVSSIPTTFIIDKNGNIRLEKTGSADWNSESFRKQIDKMLNE